LVSSAAVSSPAGRLESTVIIPPAEITTRYRPSAHANFPDQPPMASAARRAQPPLRRVAR